MIMAEDSSIICKLEDYCRLCLKIPGCVDIFETYLLRQNIYSCIGIMVNATDKMPRTVCKSCFDIVNKAYHLRLTAIANEKHLNKIMNKLENSSDTNQEEFVMKSGSDHIELTQCIIMEKLANNTNVAHDTYILYTEDTNKSQPSLAIKVRSDLFQKPTNEIRKDVIQETETSRTDTTNNKMESRCKETIRVKEEPQISENDVTNKIEHKCDICRKSFTTRKKLYLHNRLHNRKYLCPTKNCGKKFSSKGDLDKHRRIHTGEKPYVCSLCNKGFTQTGTLKSHLASVHGLCKIDAMEELHIS